MYLGTRRIRSAGRSSGSIEVTLPATLQDLEGVQCRLLVRDGPRPEIVLQPDLSAAQLIFGELWAHLRSGLSDVDDLGELSLSDFSLALFAGGAWADRPPLACADALAAGRQRTGGTNHDAIGRLVAALAVVAGRRLGLRSPLDLAFGDAVAHLLGGGSPGLGSDFERGMAHQRFAAAGGALGSDPLTPRLWQQARPGLRSIVEQFLRWQADPPAYHAARERWYRALTMELQS